MQQQLIVSLPVQNSSGTQSIIQTFYEVNYPPHLYA